VALVAGVFAVLPRRANASVNGLWKDQYGNKYCGNSCGEGQQCCEIKILPAG
jgi:hypothetical protein